LLKSGAYQKAFIKPRYAKPSAVSSMARRLAGKEDRPRLKDMPERRIEPTLSDDQ
jgi:hypothetical protein